MALCLLRSLSEIDVVSSMTAAASVRFHTHLPPQHHLLCDILHHSQRQAQQYRRKAGVHAGILFVGEGGNVVNSKVVYSILQHFLRCCAYEFIWTDLRIM